MTSNSQKYRPDFIIHGNKESKIFIEVLGSKNEEYLFHKEILSNEAKSECKHYISVKGYNLNNEYASFKATLTSALIDICH